MPSNPVDEARGGWREDETEDGHVVWRRYEHEDGDEPEVMILPAALVGAIEQAIREQERSRYEGLLADALDALRENITTWITLHPLLNEPYPDDPRWTPWTRFGKRAADRAVEAQTAIRAVLYAAPPATPSAPAVSVWLVEKDERSRTGQHLWSMWHLDGHVEWTPDANLADQYETQAEAGMAALRITEAKGSPCHATEHVFIEGLSATSAPAEKEG